MKKIIFVLVCTTLLFGCSDYPTCSDNQITRTVKKILRDKLGNSINNSILVENIRTINRNNKTGRNECAATIILQSNNSLFNRNQEITYTVEITDDKKQIYVMVYGFLF